MALTGLQVQLPLPHRPDRWSLAGVDLRRCQVCPANRTGDVGIEPGVDAIDVEDVETGVEEAERVVARELGEADGALERAALPLSVSLRLRVGHRGERVKHGRVKPETRCAFPRGSGGGGCRGGELPGGSTSAATEVDREEAQEEEAADKGDDEGDDDGVDGEVVVTVQVAVVGSVGRGLGGGAIEE